MKNITAIKNIFYIFLTTFILIAFISCSSTTPPPKKTTTTEKKAEKPTEKKEENASLPAKDPKVSEAVYNKTFSDINNFITMLNKIISDSKFDEWKRHLTQDYINHYSNPANLKEISDNPTLKKYKITLRSLKDYFNYVVVPSRSDAHLDSISFVDDNNVKAYMIIEGEPVILYNLVKINNNWKVEK